MVDRVYVVKMILLSKLSGALFLGGDDQAEGKGLGKCMEKLQFLGIQTTAYGYILMFCQCSGERVPIGESL